jgi:hypothetical protein
VIVLYLVLAHLHSKFIPPNLFTPLAMSALQPDGSLEDRSDLGELWHQALADFKGNTQWDITQFEFKNMEDAIQSTQAQQISFGIIRHNPQSKIDEVRSAFSRNLNNIQRIVVGAKMAADAAAVFPPAIPGAVLMAAFTYVFQTFRDVSADYDRVLGFYNAMGGFLDKISMLEQRSPKLEPFERCVRTVFASMLTLCGIAAHCKVNFLVFSLQRRQHWMITLVLGTKEVQEVAPCLGGWFRGSPVGRGLQDHGRRSQVA